MCCACTSRRVSAHEWLFFLKAAGEAQDALQTRGLWSGRQGVGSGQCSVHPLAVVRARCGCGWTFTWKQLQLVLGAQAGEGLASRGCGPTFLLSGVLFHLDFEERHDCFLEAEFLHIPSV